MLSYISKNMQFSNKKSGFLKTSLKFIFLLSIMLSFPLITFSSVKAFQGSEQSIDPHLTITPIPQTNGSTNGNNLPINLVNCPAQIIADYNQIQSQGNNQNYYSLKGTYIATQNGASSQTISCVNISDIQVIILRLFVLIIVVIALVFSFSVAKSAILMMTAFEDPEKYQTAIKSLIVSITALVGTFVSYILIIFIMTNLLGIGPASNSGLNLICNQRLIFSIVISNNNTGC